MGNNISRPESPQASHTGSTPNTPAQFPPNQQSPIEPRDQYQPQSPILHHDLPSSSSNPTLPPSAPLASTRNIPPFHFPPPAIPLSSPTSYSYLHAHFPTPTCRTAPTADPILETYDAALESSFLRDRDAGVDIGLRNEYPIFTASRPGDPTSLMRRVRGPVRNAIDPQPGWVVRHEGEPQGVGSEEYDAHGEGRDVARRGSGRVGGAVTRLRDRAMARRQRERAPRGWFDRVWRDLEWHLRREDEAREFLEWSRNRGLRRMELGDMPEGMEWCGDGGESDCE